MEANQLDKIRMIILEDHIATAEGYRARLAGEPDIEIVAMLSYGQELEDALGKTPCDVLLLDLRVPISAENRDSFPTMYLLPDLLERHPDLSVLVISMYDRPAMIDAVLEAGADGYVLKDDNEAYQELPMLVRMIARGNMYLSARVRENWEAYRMDEAQPNLTPRQVQALSLCASFPNERLPELAQRMNLANATLRATLWGAYRKLGVNSRPAAVTRARQIGLLPAEVDFFDSESQGRGTKD
jgi:DNA-binding NarL/FixJ family response regulator